MIDKIKKILSIISGVFFLVFSGVVAFFIFNPVKKIKKKKRLKKRIKKIDKQIKDIDSFLNGNKPYKLRNSSKK